MFPSFSSSFFIAVFVVFCCSSSSSSSPFFVSAQTTAVATPVPVGIQTTTVESDEPLLAAGDLILKNPIQSTSIFFIIIFLSTALEYLFELLDNKRNAYIRNIILSTKEELAAVAFSQMILIFLSLVVGFSDIARSVTLLATLMIVFMCLNFAVYVVIVNVLQSRRSLEWSTFEWARIDLDALHTKQEALFKNARAVFLRRSKVGPKVRAALSDGKEGPTSIMPVLFSSYLGHVERRYLKESFDFTWVTWAALLGIVIVDGLRSITVNSIGDKGTDQVASTQILTFVFVIGWGLLLLLVAVAYFQRKRIAKAVMRWNLSGSFADVTSGTESGAGRRAGGRGGAGGGNEGPLLDEGHDADEKPQRSDEEQSEVVMRTMFFNTVAGALSVLQVFMLGILWFSCVFLVGMTHFSWQIFGAVALIIYFAAALPFFVAVTVVLPNALTDIFIAAAISCDFDDDIVVKSVNGEYDLRQVEAEDSDDDDGGGGGGGDSPASADAVNRSVASVNRHRKFAPGMNEDNDFDDEVDAPMDEVSLGLGATGASPLRIQGVPPSATAAAGGKPGQYAWGKRRPIFTAPMGNVSL